MQGSHLPEGELAEDDAGDFEDSLLSEVSHADLTLRMPRPGMRLGGADGRRFTLLDELGGGAMGRVFRAWDEELQRRVALKFLLPQGASDGEPSFWLKQEARAIAQLDHEHIVRVFDMAEWSSAAWEPGVPFLVMECVEGESLGALLQRERPSLRRTLDILTAVAAGLAHAHAHHVIHRDLKPSNVLLTQAGGVKLLDFGLAHLLAPSPRLPLLPTAGTPAYMAPEQWRGAVQDERTDLWAAGILLHELLTGTFPYTAASLRELREQILSPGPVPSVRERMPALPEELGRLVSDLLAKAPAQRLPSAAVLQERLRQLQEALGPWREPARPALPQRRQVTLVSFKLVGLTQPLEHEDASELQAAFLRYCAESLRQYQGTLALSMGNEVLACFGHPRAQEDDSERAVRAALHVTQTFPGQLPHLARLGLGVSAGLHTDLIVFEGAALLGEAPRLAGWLAQQGRPGSVVLGDTTWKLTRGVFETELLGRQVFETLSGRQGVELHRVLREREVVFRFERALMGGGLSPLVGREHELAWLRALWAQARQGEGAFLLLTGEAGVGKSRLLQELREQVPAESCHLLLCQCWSQLRHTAFHPLLERVRHFQGEARLAKLGLTPEHVHMLEELLARPTAREPAMLFVLEPRERKRRMLDALQALLLRLAEERPVLFLVEDLHWADASTLELLGLLLERTRSARLLVLLSTRPKFQPSWPQRPWFNRLVLDRLPAAPTAALARQVAGGRPLSEETLQQLVTRTDGIPLFVEELTRRVLEQGPEKGLPALPITLHELLLARLDSLPPRQKALAQLCAVVGRRFDLALLAQISAREEASLRQEVEALVASGVLLAQREEADGVGYQFRHVLLQEAAYQSLPRSLRRQHHQRIAQALLEHFPSLVESRPEVLAHHRTEAGDYAPAVHAWTKAAELALLRSAFPDARTHLNRALQLMPQLPDTPERRARELELLNVLPLTLLDAKGFDSTELEQTYERALELSRRTEQFLPQRVFLLMGLSTCFAMKAKFQQADALLREVLTLGQQEPGVLIQGYQLEGFLSLVRGQLSSAEQSFEQMWRFVQQQGKPQGSIVPTATSWVDQKVDAQLLLLQTLTLRGQLRKARENSREVLALLQAASSPITQGYGLVALAGISQLRHDVQGTLHWAEQGSPFCSCSSTWGRPLQAMVEIFRGWAWVRRGQVREGFDSLRSGMALLRELGLRVYQHHYLSLLADAHLTLGQVREGLAAVDEALGVAKASGIRFGVAEVYRLQGELLRVAGKEEKALRCFLRARALARWQEAGLHELRATVSLARLLRDRGCPEQARRRLEQSYARLTPDPDSVDLREARALLDAFTQ